MQVWPAIDLRGGKCVRLRQGDYQQETVFAENPAAVARKFADEGAKHLHIVDLEGAREGLPVNLPSVQEILAAIDLEEQLGRHEAALRRIDRLIAQSPRNPAWLARRGELLERMGETAEAKASYAKALAAIEARPAAQRSQRTAALERRLRAALADESSVRAPR